MIPGIRTLLWSLLVVLTFPTAVAAQAAAGAPAGRIFDPATVRTVEGEVAEVQRIPQGNRYEGVHLVLTTGQDQPLDVHLGPSWYLDPRLPKLSKGDRVQVKGSAVTLDGKPALIAQEVRAGGERIVLRDASGTPAWSGAGRR